MPYLCKSVTLLGGKSARVKAIPSLLSPLALIFILGNQHVSPATLDIHSLTNTALPFLHLQLGHFDTIQPSS